MGSLTARAFAERYPEEVKGAVLVDPRDLSLHEDFPADFPEERVPSGPPPAVRMQAVAARLGIVRLLDPLATRSCCLPDRAPRPGLTLPPTPSTRGCGPTSGSPRALSQPSGTANTSGRSPSRSSARGSRIR